MARVDLREVVNKPGTVYDAAKTTYVYAEDHLGTKSAIDDGTAGINTEQVEVGGTLVIDSSGVVQNGAGVFSYKDKKEGVDCTGLDGAINRVLTLTNTSITKNVKK